MKGKRIMANITKRDVLNALNTVDFAEEISVGDVVVTPNDIKEYIEKSLTQIDARNEKAAERQAKKRAEGDALRAQVKEVIGESPIKIADIVAALDDPEITTAKVVARVTQLVKAGEIFKSEVREDGRSLKVYSTVPFDAE